ncbi:hypothetical protein [Virgibacillus ndiopensis]|uniref:hypothetical protein n=1 Tax=Virgibacillus ndiopensis TaxID=2004408 RepID=UPI000C076928|nr:hypothetical protein [Virgibacillus ndiopensis]
MKYILTVSIVFLLLISGCGTTKETSTQKAQSNQQHGKKLVNLDNKKIAEMFLDLDTPTKEEANNIDVNTNKGGNTSNSEYDLESETKNKTEEKENINEEQNVVNDDVFLKLVHEYNHIFDRIVSDVDYNKFYEQYIGYRFKTIKTKKELYNKFSDIMTKQVAHNYWDDFINEGKGSLYLIPKDGHPKLNMDDSYSIEKINNSKYKLTNKHNSDLHGKFDIILTFTKHKDIWKISDISYY